MMIFLKNITNKQFEELKNKFAIDDDEYAYFIDLGSLFKRLEEMGGTYQVKEYVYDL